MIPDYLDNIVQELHGPGNFRFILQPVIALLLGMWDGKKDAMSGKEPFLMTILLGVQKRSDLWKEGLHRIGKPLLISMLMEMILEIVILKRWVPFQAIFVGTFLIALPYLTARGLTNRIFRLRHPNDDFKSTH